MKELLDQLREKDPETWKKIVRGLPIAHCHEYYTNVGGLVSAHKYKIGYIPLGELHADIALAWSQAVLQDACQAKKLNWEVSQYQMGEEIFFQGGITKFNERGGKDLIGIGDGDSPAEALLKAYLAAIELSGISE